VESDGEIEEDLHEEEGNSLDLLERKVMEGKVVELEHR